MDAVSAAPSAATPVELASPRLAASTAGRSLRLVILATSLGLVMAFADIAIVNVAFPSVRRSFPAVTLGELSWMLSGYSIASAAFMVPFGCLADLVGRKRVFIAGIAGFGVASALCASASTPAALIAARSLQGLAAAAIVPTGFALVLAAFPPERRAEGVMISAALTAVAAAFGPAIGGLLVQVGGWRTVFLVNPAVALVAGLTAARVLTDSRGEAPKGFPDILGAVVFAVAIGLLTLAIVQGQTWGWQSGRTLLALTAAAGLLGAFIVRTCRHESPLFDRQLLKARRFNLANVSHATVIAGFSGYTLVNVLFLSGVWHYSALQVGGALSPGPIIATVVGLRSPHLVKRFGFPGVLVPGGFLWSVGVAWFAVASTGRSEFLAVWLPGAVIAGTGAGLVVGPGASAALSAAPTRAFGAASGVQQVCRALGAAIGVDLAVAFLATHAGVASLHDSQQAWIVFAGILAVGAVSSLAFGSTKPEESNEHSRRR